ncbi:hypothetical protein F4813DRAFT_235271 [Daldinia decipiens]|uniref:uncharacterized protein n=1 Tax=Daldinia decipiens TaxID=326647 RepID=UPI0020C36898|nr:uncharacterized protein F4813DRAFT_235271 [Daldinia decipiens]KAI1654108.1 hypothetical protein F4813DRAFT_235271 [Daldinia decipiens]
MGNSISAEAPWKGHRASQKLSKPKTSNPTAAGLLNNNGASNPPRHSPAARRASLPHAPISATPPMLPEKDPIVSVSVSSGEKGLDLGHRISRRLFRSNTSKDVPRHHRRSNSVEVPDLPQDRWSNRIGSLGNGFDEGYNYGQAPVQVSLSKNTSRTSFNYDLFSYEAQRLSNIVSETPREDHLASLENRIHVSEAMRGDFRGRRPSIHDTPPSRTPSNSDLSLYTPMRRRSFMTPGVATREVRMDSDLPKPKTRYSVPSTPARRESMESTGIGTISLPHQLTNLEPVPRALTPCEAEYTQTGAFKHGTLRITNGSPARSPARSSIRDLDGDTKYGDTGILAVTNTAEDYFGTVQAAPTNHIETQSSEISVPKVEIQINSNAEGVTSARPILSQRLSELPGEYQISPPTLKGGELIIPDIYVTSKNTAIEDRLFEDDDQGEYSSVEVLDVRVDTNAKSMPPRAKPAAEGRSSKEISRSDSGIASPASEYSAAPLSKADSGYSSSVSLRSFSSRPQAPEKDRTIEVMSDTSVKQSRRAGELEATSPIVATASVDVFESSKEPPPPPVPMKDPHLVAPTSPKTPGEQSPRFQQAPRSEGISQPTQAPERTLPPRNTWNHPSRSIETYRSSLRSPPTSSPSRSTTTGFRKPGKLQRFLSGSRAPLAAHNTHPVGYARVPAVSRDMHAKLQIHARSRPISFRKLALRSAASKETLGTILSVGSAELLQDEDLSPKTLGGQIIAPGRNQGTPLSLESKATNNSSALLQKSVRRKPVPARSYDTSPKPPTIIKTSPENKLVQVASPRTTNRDPNNSTNISASNDRTSTYIPRQPSSSTLVGHMEEGSRMINARRSYEFAQGKSHSATSLEVPPPVPSSRFSKSPPPVSMRTRNMGTLRIPPVRSKSTPPENMGRPGRTPYSRKGSREGNLTTPDVSGTFAANQTTVPRRSSRENFQNYPPSQARHYIDKSSSLPALNGVQPINVRPEVANQAPSWDVQIDHGPSLSRRSSDYSRRSSLASQSSQRSAATAGPVFFRQPHHSQPNLPLRRQPSYDEYNIVPQDSCARDNGPYPSLSRNGQIYVSDPWSGRSMSLPQQLDQQWHQPIQHPTPPPRHHTRHQSIDQQGNPMPYRVLHSYHSPAYRNSPIWR